jgi:hypothetical protein
LNTLLHAISVSCVARRPMWFRLEKNEADSWAFLHLFQLCATALAGGWAGLRARCTVPRFRLRSAPLHIIADGCPSVLSTGQRSRPPCQKPKSSSVSTQKPDTSTRFDKWARFSPPCQALT